MSNHDRPRFWKEVMAPVSVVVIATAVLTLFDTDMRVQRHFWNPTGGWHMGNTGVPETLYNYGTLPALITGISGLIVALLSIKCSSLRSAWRAGLFLALTLAVGPGLLVNTLFKSEWGRPRPKQIAEFGGGRSYTPYWEPTAFKEGRSFPSGHASMGFYLMSPYFLDRRQGRRRAWLWLALGIFAGGLMGWVRMTQGGHFLTDVIWAGVFVYLAGWLSHRLVYHVPVQPDTVSSPPSPAIISEVEG